MGAQAVWFNKPGHCEVVLVMDLSGDCYYAIAGKDLKTALAGRSLKYRGLLAGPLPAGAVSTEWPLEEGRLDTIFSKAVGHWARDEDSWDGEERGHWQEPSPEETEEAQTRLRLIMWQKVDLPA